MDFSFARLSFMLYININRHYVNYNPPIPFSDLGVEYFVISRLLNVLTSHMSYYVPIFFVYLPHVVCREKQPVVVRESLIRVLSYTQKIPRTIRLYHFRWYTFIIIVTAYDMLGINSGKYLRI